MPRPRFLPDNFTLGLLGAVLLASLLPCSGAAAHWLEWLTDGAIGLLFFLHGAKLSRQAVLAGITHWRLHLVVLAATFALFPLLGLVLQPLLGALTTPELALGLLYLCLLPSTVQSSIAFVSVAEGNVPAAICSATASNLLGIALTPLLVGWLLLSGEVGRSGGSALAIVYQLLLPFVAGQLLRPWLGQWVDRHKSRLKLVDQGSILLVVYTAFSAAVIGGLWHATPLPALGGLLLACALLLALALGLTRLASRKLGFNLADEITIVFCGSKKSLASGVPMAKVLFAGHAIGAIVLPLMLFHQLQLMVCALLARRYRLRQQQG
ncbi:bile acid:sodium symporter family protein [Vogesella oryzae]|uniref:bile acid:sodium symporter family protein n=1 Tax=Vogesella oryzae TaxID=1735285 RepID=UPI001582E51C|nr:bile acid:sodium symporter family protein [Vogesella oryzae]